MDLLRLRVFVLGFSAGFFAGWISARLSGYPRKCLSALGMAFLYGGILLRRGITLDSLRLCGLFFCLTAASLHDYMNLRLPNSLLFTGLILSLLRFPEYTSILGGMLLLGIPLLLYASAAERISAEESFGGGDIKLAAVLGAHFGAAGGWHILLMAGLAAVFVEGIIKKRGRRVFPFGPYMTISAALYGLFF